MQKLEGERPGKRAKAMNREWVGRTGSKREMQALQAPRADVMLGVMTEDVCV